MKPKIDRFLLPVLLLLVSSARLNAAELVYPGLDWERDTKGLSPESVRGVDAFVRTLDTTGLMVVQHGRVIYEFGDVTRLSYLASARKSVLSMLYGPYVASRKIRLDATLKDLGMSDLGGLLPVEERAKVIDLITARAGAYHRASNPGDLLFMAPKRGSKEPGSWWLYNNWDFNAAGAAFEKMTGKDIYDALRDNLAIPIDMQDFERRRQQKSGDMTASQYPAYHMLLSTRDMARLGLLMLRQGRWRDRQLIPAEWVRRSTTVCTPPAGLRPWELRNGPLGYGYMWWAWDGSSAAGPYRGAYTAIGAYGQYITVLPELDMVVAHKSCPPGKVSQSDYFHLLNLLTRNKPASSTELTLWKHIPRVCRIFRRASRGPKLLMDAVDIRPTTAGLVAGVVCLGVFLFLKKFGFRKCFQVAVPTAAILVILLGVVAWLLVPATAPALPKARIAVRLDPKTYDAYAGRYLMDGKFRGGGVVITIKHEGDALIRQEPGRFPEEIFPESETVFFNNTEDLQLTFKKNSQGEVTAMIHRLAGLPDSEGKKLKNE